MENSLELCKDCQGKGFWEVVYGDDNQEFTEYEECSFCKGDGYVEP